MLACVVVGSTESFPLPRSLKHERGEHIELHDLALSVVRAQGTTMIDGRYQGDDARQGEGRND